MTQTYFAWYSKKNHQTKIKNPSIRSDGKKNNFIHIYLGIDGSEKYCTHITHSLNHKIKWKDLIYIGEVTHFLRNVKASSCIGILAL